MRTSLATLLFLLVAPCGFAAETEFEGSPLFRIDISGSTPGQAKLNAAESQEYRVVIVKEGGRYLWRSRENTPLTKIVGGGVYITYVATNGSGYIRVVKPEFRESLKHLEAVSKTLEFSYSEHITNQLGSITYLGK